MRDESARVAGLSLPSMGAGNTIDDPAGHAMALAGPGSPSVNPLPDRTDNTPLPEPGSRQDYAHLKSAAGGDDSRPGESGPWTRPGNDDGGFSRV